MSICARYSWPCPFHEKKVGTLILTEDRLYLCRSAEPAKVEALPEAAEDGMIVDALPKNTEAISRSEIEALRRRRDWPRFQIVTANRRVLVALGDDHGSAAGNLFESLARDLGFSSFQEGQAGTLETLGNSLLGLLLVLIGGVYLGVLAEQEGDAYREGRSGVFKLPWDLAHWVGPSAVWGGTAAGVIACLVWMGWRLRDPARVIVATGVGKTRASRASGVVGEDELRTTTARILGIDARLLTPETKFLEDLKIPPGELLDGLGELEERLEIVVVEAAKIRTFGDLLALRSGVTRRR